MRIWTITNANVLSAVCSVEDGVTFEGLQMRMRSHWKRTHMIRLTERLLALVKKKVIFQDEAGRYLKAADQKGDAKCISKSS